MSEALSPEDKALFDGMRGDTQPVTPAEADTSRRAQPQEAVDDNVDPDIQEAAQEPAAPQQPEPDATPKMVDKRALDEERRQARELRDQLREQQLVNARSEERFQMLRQALEAQAAQQQTAPQTPKVDIPDIQADPVGHIKGMLELQKQQTEQRLAEMQRHVEQFGQTRTQMQQQQEQQRHIADLTNWLSEQETSFRQIQPDYNDAANHVIATGRRQAQAFGITNPQEVNAFIQNQTMAWANQARQRNIPFGQMVYDIAQSSGYTPQQAAAQAPSPVNNQQAQQQRLQRGQDMAHTIGAVGGAPRGASGPETIAKMDDAEFATLYAKALKTGGSAIRNILGN